MSAAQDLSPDDPAPRYVGPKGAPRVAARTPDEFLAAMGRTPVLDTTTAWWVLAFQEYPVHRSFFEGVTQVASREVIETGPDGSLSVRVPEGPPLQRLGGDEAASALRSAVLEAVEDTLRDAKRPGVLLSGGLDSSIVAVAASAAWQRLGRDPQELRLHHSLPVAGEGEAAHARAVAEYLRLPLQLRRAGWADPYEGTEECLRRMYLAGLLGR